MKRKSFIGLLVIAGVGLLVGWQAVKPVEAMMVLNSQGQVMQVLGDQENDSEDMKVKMIKEVREAGQKVRNMHKEMRSDRKEAKERVQTMVKNEGKMEASKGARIRIKVEGGRLLLQKEMENGKKELMGRDSSLEVENRLGGKKFNLRVSDNNEILVEGKRMKAKIKLPVSIDPDTNELTITTPAGSKKVTILPDEAVEKILGKAVDMINKAELTTVNDKLVYEIEGTKKQKFLGIFKVVLPKTVMISAETGKVVKEQQAWFNKIVDLLSF